MLDLGGMGLYLETKGLKGLHAGFSFEVLRTCNSILGRQAGGVLLGL